MDDLLGLDFNEAPKSQSSQVAPAAAARGTGNYYVSTPTPPLSISRKSTPLSSIGLTARPSATAAPPPTKQNVDSFANLVSFGGKKETLSLQEQQEKIERERRAKDEERRKKEDSFWDGLGGRPGAGTNPFQSPSPVVRAETPAAPHVISRPVAAPTPRPTESNDFMFGETPAYISSARHKKVTPNHGPAETSDDVLGTKDRQSLAEDIGKTVEEVSFWDGLGVTSPSSRSPKPPTPKPAASPVPRSRREASDVDLAKVESLEQMGFSSAQARSALRETDGDVERAVDWLFNLQDNRHDPAARRSPREAISTDSQNGDAEIPKWMRQPTKEEKLWKGFKGMTEKGLKGMSEKLFGDSSSRSSSAKPPLVPDRPKPSETSERSSRSSSSRPPALPSRPRRFVEDDELPVYTSAARRKKATPSPRPVENVEQSSSSGSSKPPTPAPRPQPVAEADLLFGDQPSVPVSVSSKFAAPSSAALLMGEESESSSWANASHAETKKPIDTMPQQRATPVARRRSEDDPNAPTWGRAATPRPAAKPRVAAPKPRLRPGQEPEAVVRMREANKEAEKADDEKFALSDSVDARISAWRDGKRDNLRALIVALDTVLWEGSGWKKVGLHELVINSKVKIHYMKAIAKTHPDKLPRDASIEVKMIGAAVFATLNEAWDKFKADNGM